MGTTVSKLTILFQEPYWIGLYEREEQGRYEVWQDHVWRAAKDYEVFDFPPAQLEPAAVYSVP
jgi:hypothetical protein